jgi:hypothetical protein
MGRKKPGFGDKVELLAVSAEAQKQEHKDECLSEKP